MFSLDSQHALVTGASRGIGKAIALHLAQQGAWVAGTSTTSEGATNFSNELAGLNLKGQGFVLDLASTDSINQLITSLKRLKKLPSILINNAGINCDGLALNVSVTAWRHVFDVNLHGTFYLTQQCLPSMLSANYGRIITISSIVALSGNAGQISYTASKAGLIGANKTLAIELAPRGITVNTIAPGLIQTDMSSQLSDTQRSHWLTQIPLNRLGKPEDIAYACLFLASKEACYITGHTLPIDGGLRRA